MPLYFFEWSRVGAKPLSCSTHLCCQSIIPIGLISPGAMVLPAGASSPEHRAAEAGAREHPDAPGGRGRASVRAGRGRRPQEADYPGAHGWGDADPGDHAAPVAPHQPRRVITCSTGAQPCKEGPVSAQGGAKTHLVTPSSVHTVTANVAHMVYRDCCVGAGSRAPFTVGGLHPGPSYQYFR